MTLEQETALLTLIADPLDRINRRAVEEAARQLKKIGTLSAKNINQLNLQYEAGLAASEIVAEVAREADTTVKHVYEVLEAVAQAEYAASESLFAFRGIDQIPYEKNATMRRNVRAIARQTSETMTNISMTRGQNVGLKTSKGFLLLKEAYPQIVDEGIQSVVVGGKSYDEATRETIKTFGGSGLRVQYDSGNTRRVDSAVRMNVLDGIRAVNAEVQREISETIKTDKVEISVHLPPLYCAPDHLEYQGLVMTTEELERLNSTTLAYPNRAIAVGALNCRHYTLAFLDGISKPRYTPDELAEVAKEAKEIHEITYTDRFGNERTWKGTIYEATQVQRQMETGLRYAKEAHNAAKVAENKTLVSELQREITGRGREYKSFSEAIGLRTQAARTRMANARPTENLTLQSVSGKVGDTDGYTVLDRIEHFDVSDKTEVPRILEKFSARYASADVEHAEVLSAGGKVYHLTGTRGAVNTSLVGPEELSGSIVVHNHPVTPGLDRADSFSREDLMFAVEHKAGKQYLVSGVRRNAFLYKGDADAETAYRAYQTAKDDVLERAFSGSLEIEFEQEEIMRVLQKYLKGFEFYEKF